VCEEHCPTPDKAIKFESKEVRLRDGNTMMVKYPFVLRELCIGCGICETKCPLPGQSAVFVTTENQRRAGVPLLQPQDQPASPYG
jgi:ferredoxin